MSSFAELHQQPGGLLATDSRSHGYADLYLQQQAEASARRSSSSFHPRQIAEAALRRSYPTEQYRVVVSNPDEGLARWPPSMPSPGQQEGGSYAGIAAAAAVAVAATGAVGNENSPLQNANGGGNGGSPTRSPRQRLDPSVSRPATTILAQATAMRSARLKQLAQRQHQLQQPQPGPASSVGRKTGRQQVRLSFVLQQAPHLYDRQRLSAVERFIDRIDVIPARYTDAQVVFLSKNSLTTVAGLEQFKQLRVLGLADNLLADPEQIEALAAATPGLEALSLEGNPIAYVPHYRARVLLALPGLKSLDGRPITDEDRGGALAAVAAEEATMAVLMRNACEVHKMASVVQRAQLHMELLHMMHSKGAVLRRVEALDNAAAAPSGRSLSRLVDMWDYEALLTAEERRKIRGALLREVGRMFRQLRAQQLSSSRALPTWEEAFAQVMTAQQQTTAMLLDLMTQCQLATDELVRGMAGSMGQRHSNVTVGLDSSAGKASGKGSGEVREGSRSLLLREAEADMERHREMRREREEVLVGFRDTALKRLRSSPLRTVQRAQPALKSALKRTTQPRSIRGDADDVDCCSDGADNDDRQLLSPSHSAPPRWQSARSSPLAPEAVERIMRARRGVAPNRASVSSAGASASTARQEEGSTHVSKATSTQLTQQQQRSAFRSIEEVPAETFNPSARIIGKPTSTRYQGQQQERRKPTVGAPAPIAAAQNIAGTGRTRSAVGVSIPGPHRRSKSVDAAMSQRHGVTGASSSRAVSASAGRIPSQQRRRLLVGSPEKVQGPLSPSSPLDRPVWRHAGGKPDSGRSPPSPVDFKHATHAVQRTMRELRMHAQEKTGTSPERLSGLAASVAAVTAAVMEGPKFGSPAQQPGLPDRGITTSPTILGRRHHAAVAHPANPQLRADGAFLQEKGPLQPASQARRSLQGALMGTPTFRHDFTQSASARDAYGVNPPEFPSPWLRASSPAAPGVQGRVPGSSAHAAVASARIDDLRREVEESALETARLRQIAEMASMPLPPRFLPGGDATAAAPTRVVQPPPWSAAAANLGPGNHVPNDVASRLPLPPQWALYPARTPASQYNFQAQSAPQPGASPPWYPQGTAWGGSVKQQTMQTPHMDVTMRPKGWGATAQGGQETSPLPQPQILPPSLQPHRGQWSGPNPAGSTPTLYGMSRALGVEGSGAGFVELYPATKRPYNPDGLQQQQQQQEQQQGMRTTWGGQVGGGAAGSGDRSTAPREDYSHAWGPTGVAASYDATWSTSGPHHHQQHFRASPQPHNVEHWAGEGSLAPGTSAGASGNAWPSACVDWGMVPPRHPVMHDAEPTRQERQLQGQQDRADGYLEQPYNAKQSAAAGQPPASRLRLQPPPFHAGPSSVSLPQGALPQAYPPQSEPAAASFHAHVQRSHPGFPSNTWEPQDAATSQKYLAPAWTPTGIHAGVDQQIQPSGLVTTPELSEGYSVLLAPAAQGNLDMQTPGHSEQVTLDDFSILRASVDVVPPGSMQPSVTGTPSHNQQPDGASCGFPANPFRTVGDDMLLEQPTGIVDTPWHQSLQLRQSREGQGHADLLRPRTSASMSTPAITLRGPPGTAGTAAPATPSVATVVSVMDGVGGAGATRVDVEEIIAEDSSGSKDQHIHLHIHPPPVQVPGTAGTDISTPQLFLQSGPERVPNTTTATPAVLSLRAPLPADSTATSAGFGMLVQPGSPLHEALSAGHLVYERIERIKPAGLTSSTDTTRETRSGATGTTSMTGESVGDDSGSKPTRKGARRRSGKAGETPRGGGSGSGRCRDDLPGFRCRRHDEDNDGSNNGGGGGGGSHGSSGGDSNDPGRGSRPGAAGTGGGGGGSRAGAGGGGRSDQGKRTHDEMTAESQTSDGGLLDDGGDDTDPARDDGGDDRRGSSHDDSVSDSLPNAGCNRFGKAPVGGRGQSAHEGARDSKRRSDQECSSTDTTSKPFEHLEHILELPPGLQQQYTSLQRQVAEQAAMNTTLFNQLQQLQSLFPQGLLPQGLPGKGHKQSQRATAEHEDDEYALHTASWTSSSPHVVAAGTLSRFSETDGSGIDTGSGPAASSPARLPPLAGSASLILRDPNQSGANSPGPDPGSRKPLHSPMCISPAAAASYGASPREADSVHSTLSLLPEGASRGSPRPVAVDSGEPSPGPPGQSPRAAGGSNLIQEQLLRNRSIQEQISRLGEQLADATASASGLLPPDLAATLAGLAASSAPLPPGSLRALEQQLVALTLEKEAVERVLIQEQAEVRMLQQELGVMAQVATALEETQAQLQEARLAVAHQQQELQERDQQLAACRQREVQLEAELAAERERAGRQVAAISSYFERQFEDARATIVAEFRGQMAAMRAGRGNIQTPLASQPRNSFLARDSRPDSLRVEVESQLSGFRSDLLSQLSLRENLATGPGPQELDEQISSQAVAGDLASLLSTSLSAALQPAQPSLHRSNCQAAAASGSLAADVAPSLDAVFANLPEALRAEVEAQVMSGRANLASEAAAVLRDDAVRHPESRHSAPAGPSLGRSRLHEAFEAEHAAQLAVMRAEHNMQVEIMRARHAAQVEELLAEKVVQPEAIREEYAAQLARVRANHTKQVDELHARHAAQIQELLEERMREPETLRAEHAAKVAALRTGHAKQIEALRAEQAEQLEELLTERSKLPEALRAEHAAKLVTLRAEHAGQMEALRSEHGAKMEVLMAERLAQPEALRAENASQMAVLRADHAKQMETVRAEHAKEVGLLLTERAALPEALRTEHMPHLEALKSEYTARLEALRTEHAAQMEMMRGSHAAQMEALLAECSTQPDVLKAEHASQLAALRADHAKQMEAVRAEHEKQMEKLAIERAAQQRNTLRAEHAAELAALHAEHNKQMEAMRAELTFQMESLLAERTAVTKALRDDHATQLETIRANHAAQLAAQSTEHAKQVEAMRMEHAKQMERLLIEHAAQPEMLRAGYSTQLAAMRAEHAMQMEALRSEHASALAEKDRQRATTAAAHEQQLQELRTEHQQHVIEITAQARQQVQRLEAEHSTAMTALTEDHQVQIARHTRRLDELLAHHKQQLDELADSNRFQLEEVRRRGEKLLAEVRAAAACSATEAAGAHEKALAELAGRLRAAEAAEAAATAARREGEAARRALQTQLEEVLAQLGRERAAASELRGRNQALEVEEAEVRRRMEKLLAPQELGWRRKIEADKLGSRFLLRRVLRHWAANARLSKRRSHQVAVITELRRRRVCRHAIHHWRTTVLRTRVLRAFLHENEVSLMRRALVSFKAHMLQHRRKARAISIALAHSAVRQLARCFEAWRQLHRMHARAAAYSDQTALKAALAHHSTLILRVVLGAWHQRVYQTQLPKTQRRRRAAHVYRRRLLRKAIAGFTQQAERRAWKRSHLARSIRRYRFSILNRAVGCWLRYLGSARRMRSLLAMADLQYGHSIVRRWRHGAARSRALRLGVAALQASAVTRRLRTCLTRWRAFLLRRRQSALALRLASEHHRGALLWRCMSAWLQLAQQSAARQLHIKGMREYQRMMQAALRWQRLVELGRRQQAVVDRAVRLYRHRVLAATQRAVLRHWRAAVEVRRDLMRSAAVSFVQAYRSIWRQKVFSAWHGAARRASGERGIEAALELRSALERNEAAMRLASARLEAVGVENAELIDQLKEARSEVLVLRQQLEDSEKRLAEAIDALATAERELEVNGADLATRADRVASLEAERDALMERVHSLRQQVSAGEVSVASLQEQASALQRSLAAAQSTVKELGLKIQQQAAHYEEQLLAARDEASLARREAGSLAATASRLEQQAADGEAQLRSMRTGHEALVASLRQELRARDAHIMVLNQQQQQQRDSAAQSRPVSAANRLPSPPFSPQLVSSEPRPCSGPSGPTTAGCIRRPKTVYAAGGHVTEIVDPRGLRTYAEAPMAEESFDEQPHDGGVWPDPLFEPSTVGRAAVAAAVRPGSHPWSTGGTRGGRAAPAAGALPRTSLLTQPLLHARQPAPVAIPPLLPHPPPPVQRPVIAASGPTAGDDGCSNSANSSTTSFAGATAEASAGGGVAAASAVVALSEGPLVSKPFAQLPGDACTSEWPKPQDLDPAEASQAEQHRNNNTNADDDNDADELPSPAQHYGASGAFRRLQAAEAALLATEDEFQRRRSHILGLETVTLAVDGGTGGTLGSLHPRSLSPHRLHGFHSRAASTGGIGDAATFRRQQNLSMPGTNGNPLQGREERVGGIEAVGAGRDTGRQMRRSINEPPDRISFQSAGGCVDSLSHGQGEAWGHGLQPQSQPHVTQPEQHGQAVRPQHNTSTDPAGATAASGANSSGTGGTEGCIPQAQVQPRADLSDLTAGIVGTLTNLREALRSQSRPPPPPSQLPPPPQPQRSGPQLSSHGGPGPSGVAAAVNAAPRSGVMQRTVIFRPSPNSSVPTSAATSDSGLRSRSTTGGGGADVIELTLRSLLQATAPPPLITTSVQQSQYPSQQDGLLLPPMRNSAESASSDTTQFSDASEALSRSLASLLNAAAASESNTGAAMPSLDSRSSGPSSLLEWLRATAPGESARELEHALAAQNAALRRSFRVPSSSGGSLERSAATVASGGLASALQRLVAAPEPGHELYTRVGAHVASVVQEGLEEAQSGGGSAAAGVMAAVPLLLTSLRRTMGLVGELSDEEYPNKNTGAY